jgi:hypothetical protein
MRNPILQQEIPKFSTSDIKFLLKLNKPKIEELKDKLALAYHTVAILETELRNRDELL